MKRAHLLVAVSLGTIAGATFGGGELCYLVFQKQVPCCTPPQLDCGVFPNNRPCNGTSSGVIQVSLIQSATIGQRDPEYTAYPCTKVFFACGAEPSNCVPAGTQTSECRDFQIGTADCP